MKINEQYTKRTLRLTIRLPLIALYDADVCTQWRVTWLTNGIPSDSHYKGARWIPLLSECAVRGFKTKQQNTAYSCSKERQLGLLIAFETSILYERLPTVSARVLHRTDEKTQSVREREDNEHNTVIWILKRCQLRGNCSVYKRVFARQQP
jgi:hypothetical protein